MRILISITNLMVGGAQTFVQRLAVGLSRKHRVYIYNYGYPDPPTDQVINDRFPPGIKISHFALPPGLARLARRTDRRLARAGVRFSTLAFLRRVHFAWLVRSHRIDVVNSHLFHSDVFTTTHCPSLGVPVVITDHGDYRYVVSQGLATEDGITQGFGAAAGLVSISESNLAVLRPYLADFRGKLRKIYYGVEKMAADPTVAGQQRRHMPPGAFVFGMVARGIPEKGWEEAILAFRQAEKEISAPIYLILVGDSPYLQELKKQYASATVHFTGYTDHPAQWVQAFDVGLLPTYFPGESLPNTIIEYLALGKPVVATDVGGIAEMIAVTGTPEMAGRLIPLREGKADVNALAEALLQYVRTPQLLREHGQKAPLAFRKFDLEACITNYELLFGEMMGNRSR